MLPMFQFDLINAKKREKKGYKNSGQIVVKSVKIEQVKDESMVGFISQRHTQQKSDSKLLIGFSPSFFH